MESNPVEIEIDTSVDDNIGDVLVVGGGNKRYSGRS